MKFLHSMIRSYDVQKSMEFYTKLFDLKQKEHKEKIEDIQGEQKDIAWGRQIRSYVCCPYTMVKDHRTNYEVGNVEAVMDGEIDDFIESYLRNNIKNKEN